MAEPFLVLDRLDKSFGANAVLRELSLTVGRGEVLALLGPSGGGKTTALRLIAGFETPDRGRIAVEGEDVTRLPPERRRFGMVFQHYALFPHLTVAENVAFGLAAQKPAPDRAETARRVAEALALVELPGFEARRPGEISGGQQQRVALARALAPEPRILLLDEPLSNLDPSLRERTRRELRQAFRRIGITTVLVTHEQEEAFHLADRIAVLEGGILHQVGSPEDLYERPATRFVATFVGRASVLPGVLEGDGVTWVPLPGPEVGAAGPVRWKGERGADLDGAEPGTPVDLVVRPEALALRPSTDAAALAGRVAERRYAGPVSYYQIALGYPGAGGGEIEVLAPSAAAAVGDTVRVALDPAAAPPRLFRRRENSARSIP